MTGTGMAMALAVGEHTVWGQLRLSLRAGLNDN